MKKTILVLTLGLITNVSFAKRMAPATIEPVSKQGNEFSFRIEQNECKKNEHCGMQVFLTSRNLATNKMNWERALYQKQFIPNLEIDVQTIFPKSLKLDKRQLVVIDERGSKYRVDFKTGDLIEPLKSIVYPKNQ